MKKIYRYIDHLIRSIIAGVMVSIACILYAENRGIVGALLFSVGIICILVCHMRLYTGLVGFYKYDEYMPLALFGNILGTMLMARFTIDFRPKSLELIQVIADEKISNNSIIYAFIMSIICGILIYTGVKDYLTNKRVIVLIICIASFVLLGAEHCIADAFYFQCAGEFVTSFHLFMYMFICVFGNTIGSYIGKWLSRLEE